MQGLNNTGVVPSEVTALPPFVGEHWDFARLQVILAPNAQVHFVCMDAQHRQTDFFGAINSFSFREKKTAPLWHTCHHLAGTPLSDV